MLHNIITRYRYALHAGFWLLYFSITLFNDLFLTSDLAHGFEVGHALRMALSGLLLLLLKMGLTYSVLYYFLPLWLRTGRRLQMSLLIALLLCCFVLLYRLIIQFVTWPLIIHYTPRVGTLSQIARFLYSLLDVLQIVGIAVIIKLLTLRLATAAVEKEYLRQKMQADVSRLRAQIHPHFLFNMLNNIYSVSKNDPTLTPQIVERMSELLRFMLYESEKKLVTVENELKVIGEYIAIERFRFGDRVTVTVTIDADDQQTPIHPLLLFPLIENAFKHGVGFRTDQSYVTFDLRLRNGLLDLSIRNSVAGHSVKSPHSGIGQPNVKKLLSLLYRQSTFETNEQNGEYALRLRVDLNSFIDFELPDN